MRRRKYAHDNNFANKEEVYLFQILLDIVPEVRVNVLDRGSLVGEYGKLGFRILRAFLGNKGALRVGE